MVALVSLLFLFNAFSIHRSRYAFRKLQIRSNTYMMHFYHEWFGFCCLIVMHLNYQQFDLQTLIDLLAVETEKIYQAFLLVALRKTVFNIGLLSMRLLKKFIVESEGLSLIDADLKDSRNGR